MSLDWRVAKAIEDKYLIYLDKGYSPKAAEAMAKRDAFNLQYEILFGEEENDGC